MNRKTLENDLIAKIKRAQVLNDNLSIKLDEIQWILARGAYVKPWHQRTQAFVQVRRIQVLFEVDGIALVSLDDSMPFRTTHRITIE
jgi:hypothetical protein